MTVAIAVIVAVVVVLLLIVGLALFLKRRAQRQRELQEMYGPEYDRAVKEKGGRKAAERDLSARAEQRSQLEIRPLDHGARQRYTQSWSEVQGRFVDDPQQALGDADELVTAVMRQRGYPTEGFDEQARLLSVDHAATLDNYRSGHHIAGLAKQREATTEQLRQGMMHYRTLFTELVEAGGQDGGSSASGNPAGHDGESQHAPPAYPHQQDQTRPVGYQEGGDDQQRNPSARQEQPTTEYRRPQFEDNGEQAQSGHRGQGEHGQTQRAWEGPPDGAEQEQAEGMRRVTDHGDDDPEGRGRPPR